MYFLYTSQLKPAIDDSIIHKTIPHHIDWVKNHIAAGDLVQAGKWGDHGGAGIIKAESMDQALHILGQDPLIDNGLVTVECQLFLPDVPIDDRKSFS